MRISRFVCAAAIMAPVVLLGQGQSLFHAAANFVEVDAVVTDSHGAFVPGLSAADFDVQEDRKPQQVSACTLVDFLNPTTPAAAPSYRADLPVDSQIAAGRIYLLYTTALPTPEMQLARRDARVFVSEFMQPGDVAAVWNAETTGRTVTFTTNKQLLLDQIDRTDTQSPAARKGQTEALQDAVGWLSGVQGRRKSLILFATSWSSDPRGLMSLYFVPDASTGMSERDLLGAGVSDYDILGYPRRVTEQADVHIYAMDVSGLTTESPTSSGPGIGARGPGGGADVGSREDAIGAIRSIADGTGGLALINSNDYRTAFKRVVDDNSRYYLLGYDAPHKPGDGIFHALTVKVLRPGVTVRARRGYITR